MRWRSKFYLKPREGDKRVVSKFLLFPRTFCEATARWLERAAIVEEIIKLDVGGSMEWGNYAWRWREISFADDHQKKFVGRYWDHVSGNWVTEGAWRALADSGRET